MVERAFLGAEEIIEFEYYLIWLGTFLPTNILILPGTNKFIFHDYWLWNKNHKILMSIVDGELKYTNFH
jgi:hypothetical protein